MPWYLTVTQSMMSRDAVDPNQVSIAGLPGVVGYTVFQQRGTGDVALQLIDPFDAVAATTFAIANKRTLTDQLSTFTDWNFVTAGPPPPRPAKPVKTPPVPYLPGLAEAQRARCVRLDVQTDVLIAKGFVVNSQTFSASNEAQLKWLGMVVSKDMVQYPITVPTIDDKNAAVLVDAADVVTFYTALLQRIQSVLSAGVALKQQVMLTTSQVTLDAVVDNRT